jgi:hypothetical protein
MNSSIPDYSEWYDRVYPELTGYGQWLRGNELNTLDPQEYHTRHFRLLIARLSTYFDTAESFSHKVLYQIARRQNTLFPDFAFLPPLHDGPVFSRDTIPWLLGTATKQGPAGFDMIAFSNAIVQELLNVPVMLEKSGISLKKSKRLADDSVPLIILGGSNSLYTSVFFVPEPPIDGIFFGESPDCIAHIFSQYAEAKEKGLSKADTLTLLESVPGFVQPDKPRKTKRSSDTTLPMNDLLADAPVFNINGLYGRGNLQISEGCPCFCSFCAESFVRKPYREIDPARIIAQAKTMKAGMGLDKVELYSFNFNMHSGLRDILQGLTGLFASIGLKSQRFDMLSHDPGMLSSCLKVGKTSITCGLEGISPRVRSYLHKSLSDKDLRAGLNLILSSAVRELKVFLIVTGREEKHDFDAFGELLLHIKDLTTDAPGKQHTRIIFSATPLVRFPWTPLESEDAPQPEALRPLIAAIRRMVEALGFEFRVSNDVNDYHLSQILVRVTDRRIYDGLRAALTSTGFVYYRSVTSLFVNELLRQCGEAGLRPARLLSGTTANDNEKPWLFFETGISRDFILRQARAAAECKDDGYCLGSADKKGECKACGACGDTDDKAAIMAPRPKFPFPPPVMRDNAENAARAAAEWPVQVLVEINDSCRGLPRAVVAAALAGAIMKTEPGCIPWYRGYANSLLSPKDGPCWTIGDDVLTLLWHRDGLEAIERTMANPDMRNRINELCHRRVTLKQFLPAMPGQYHCSVVSPYPFVPKEYCARRGLTHVLRKSGHGYSLDFTKQALKKRLVLACSYQPAADGGVDLGMTVTMKFDLEEFAQEAFLIDKSYNWVRIRMRASF